MNEMRKVPAAAGAEWLLGGFALLRKAPLALVRLGAIWVLFSLLAAIAASVSPALGMLLQLLMGLAGPVFFAGFVWAVHEVEQDRAATPGSLLEGLRRGKLSSLLMTLLPQVVAGFVLGFLLLLLLGKDGLEQGAKVIQQVQAMQQSGEQPDPAQLEALVASLPVGRILAWLLLVFIAFLMVTLTVFVAVPLILFGQSTGAGTGLLAMRDSLRSCLHNLSAVLVFFLLTGLMLFALTFVANLVILILQMILGLQMAALLVQLSMLAVLMPLFAGSAYVAWKQMFGVGGMLKASLPAGTIEV